MRADGFSSPGLSLYELIIKTWFKIDRVSILIEFIPLQRVAKQLLI